MTRTIGSLFAGIGGLELGLERAGVGHTSWQVEIDPFCKSVLSRHWPQVTRYEDVKSVGAHNLARVDVLCGGFPCQDVSSAGKRAGVKEGTRSGLWFEYRRIISELRPEWVIVENVASGAKLWLPTVRRDLHVLGYDSAAIALSAADVGAPHLRRRIFVLAHTERFFLREQSGGCGGTSRQGPALAHEHGEEWELDRFKGPQAGPIESGLGGAFDGLPARLDSSVKDAESEKGRPEEGLRKVPHGVLSRQVFRETGGSKCVPEEKALFPKLRQFERTGRVSRQLLESATASEGRMREMCKTGHAGSPSLRREPRQQFARQYSDPLRKLPHHLAPRSASSWAEAGWESTASRTHIAERLDSPRLKALGNAVVSQCAEVIGWMLIDAEGTYR